MCIRDRKDTTASWQVERQIERQAASDSSSGAGVEHCFRTECKWSLYLFLCPPQRTFSSSEWLYRCILYNNWSTPEAQTQFLCQDSFSRKAGSSIRISTLLSWTSQKPLILLTGIYHGGVFPQKQAVHHDLSASWQNFTVVCRLGFIWGQSWSETGLCAFSSDLQPGCSHPPVTQCYQHCWWDYRYLSNYRHRPEAVSYTFVDCRQRLWLVRSTLHCYNMLMTLSCPPTLPLVYNVSSLPPWTHLRYVALLSTPEDQSSSPVVVDILCKLQSNISVPCWHGGHQLCWPIHIPRHTMSRSCLLNDDIDNRIRLASSAFGRLQAVKSVECGSSCADA